MSLKEASGPPSSSKGYEETAMKARGRRSVFAMRCLCCVCFGTGKANKINWENRRVQMAASVAKWDVWDGLSCPTGLTA